MLRHDPHSSHVMGSPIRASIPLRHDPRSSHAMKTPIRASIPIGFANTTRTEVFQSLKEQVFCLVSEIQPRFLHRNMLRHDPHFAHAMTIPIRASIPLGFANTMRTDVFHSHAQQGFCS
ncbi:uncharacterized protein G2W53_026506 [Senna tora]|uniref:Uncharacterized protein n=1 Tax=Senna tora TaxID=362788 RepID=A0A834THB5_9FABA|nr:uncharacterized protein G2W53_026506 [Senna tora]